MISVAVIAEYNPFHNGHQYMLRQLRRKFGQSAVIAVIMSGSFVQRGEPALFDKWSRAAWALAGGADCVVELPALYALSSAEGFAAGAVRLAERLGCTHLACGVEQGSAGDFHALADAALSIAPPDGGSKGTYGQYITGEIEKAVSGERAALLSSPNALLAAEYVKAIHQYAPAMEFIPVIRRGSHDAPLWPSDIFASASALRRAIKDSGKASAAAPYVPSFVLSGMDRLMAEGRCADYGRYGDFILYGSRLAVPEQLTNLPAFSEGLENRWIRCLSSASSWPEALAALKTRRYSYSRLCRMGAYTALAVQDRHMKQAYAGGPQYARLLGASPSGTKLLKNAKKSIPVITRLAAGEKKLPPFGRQMLRYDIKSTDLQALCFHGSSCRRGLTDYYTSPVLLPRTDDPASGLCRRKDVRQ